MNLSEIRPYPKNAKKHPEKQVKQIADSIKEFGFNQPIVIDKKNVIIVGHGRYEAAKLLKMEDVPVLQVDLTEEQAKAYRLADNKLNESDWDMQLAVEELKELSKEMAELTGFDLDLLIEPDEKDDEVPETPEKPQSKLGDLYISGSTLIAAEKTNRICYGMELDPKYTDVIVQRYVDYTSNENIIKNGKEIIWRKSEKQ